MNDISRKTLQKIKSERVQPLPRWRFVFRGTLLWGAFVLSLLLGSLACGVVIFQLTHAEWEIFRYLRGEWTVVFWMLPYFWLAFMAVFTWVASGYFRRVRRGYRYPTVWLVTMSLVFSAIGGGVVYRLGMVQRLETAVRKNVAFYRALQERKARIWMSPQNGLLAGEVVAVLSGDAVNLKDLNGHLWFVDVKDARWRGRLSLQKGIKIKVIGKMKGKKEFIAREIRPWQGREWRRFFRHGLGKENGLGIPGEPRYHFPGEMRKRTRP